MATPVGRESPDAPVNAIARSALDATAVRELLADRPAVVLERTARGAGVTRWFSLASARDLERLLNRLAPGSRVSFYFDGRIAACTMNDATVIRILELVAGTGDAVVGTLGSDGLEISVHIVAGMNELGEFTEELAHGAEVFIGAFPAPDDDHHDAVTLTLPDRDGLTRSHPHGRRTPSGRDKTRRVLLTCPHPAFWRAELTRRPLSARCPPATADRGPGPTVMAVGGDLGRFAEPAQGPAWLDPVLVVCPRCAARATVSGDKRTARLVCEACGLARTWSGERLHVVVDGAPLVLDRGEHAWVDPDTGRGVRVFVEPQGVDSRFGTRLWLRSQCCGGKLLWANNAVHLDYLEAYVSAGLRERTPGPAALSAKLPAWMKSAKDRDEILKHIRRLRRHLDAVEA